MKQQSGSEAPLDLRSLGEGLDDEMRAERAESLRGPDSALGRDLARAIGENVARYRAQRGMDVPRLAVATDLPEEQLKLVEAGNGLPGLRMLWRLASGLQVPFGALLEHTLLSEAADPSFRIQRADRGRVISTPGGLVSRALATSGRAGPPEVYDLTLAPGTRETADAHAPETFEQIIVTAGRLHIEVGEKVADLGPGDSITFQADAAHAYENGGAQPARALLIMTYR
jgi:XRE family transcriptional regulator, regulator of sulfur utilization